MKLKLKYTYIYIYILRIFAIKPQRTTLNSCNCVIYMVDMNLTITIQHSIVEYLTLIFTEHGTVHLNASEENIIMPFAVWQLHFLIWKGMKSFWHWHDSLASLNTLYLHSTHILIYFAIKTVLHVLYTIWVILVIHNVILRNCWG
jgi:hypothetical protein